MLNKILEGQWLFNVDFVYIYLLIIYNHIQGKQLNRQAAHSRALT